MSDYSHGETINFRARAEDVLGNGITNADLIIRIWRQSDNMYWTGAAWQVAIADIPMIENADTTNFAGDWSYAFDTTPHAIAENYYSQVVDDSGNAVNAPFEIDVANVGSGVAALSDNVNRILGLQKDNFVHEPLTYNENGTMKTGRIRVYDSVANANTDDGVTGLLYAYDITAELTLNKLIKYTQTRVQ